MNEINNSAEEANVTIRVNDACIYYKKKYRKSCKKMVSKANEETHPLKDSNNVTEITKEKHFL